MPVGDDPEAFLAFAARSPFRIATVHTLCDPAGELQASRARILVDQDAMRQAPGSKRRLDFLAGGTKPFGQRLRIHRVRAGSRPRTPSSAASAASQTTSSC